ncbi:MAG: hypothetical protein A2W74_08140 [Planctomycetes bacterium RIFCSPLOWO2_12_38_17]|nr:MAG: hypothetical protein A2W74_08140 [Planctomycetes bacterium RIFCSPLOWO2_12_38_17]
MIKVLLVNTPDDKKPVNRDMAGGLGFDRSKTTVLPPMDLLNYATFLEQKGYSVVLFDSQVESPAQEQIERIANQFKPNVTILTASLPSVDNDISFAKWLKGILPFSSQIIFKIGTRFRPIVEKILRSSGCTYCIIGECDLVIDQILTGHTMEGTARLLNDEYHEQQETLLKDISQLPIPNRKLLNNDAYRYPALGDKTTTMQTSRGCSFSCSYYCPYPLVQGKTWRAMNASRVVSEIETIIRENKIENILFRDATFTLDKKRTQEICHLIIEKSLSFSWWCETRIDCLGIDLIDIMKKAGCVGMNIGVETGDEALLAERAKQGVTLSKIIQLTQHCKKVDIKLRVLLMMGLPGETKQTLYKTFKLVEQVRPDYIGLTTVTPYPGTPFYEDALKNHWIKTFDINTFGGHGYNTQIDPLTSEDLKFAMDKIHMAYRFGLEDSATTKAGKDKLQKEFLEWVELQ